MFRLDHKTAVITGAGSGIGQAIALLFARQGARIHIVDRDESAATATAQIIRDEGNSAEVSAVDISDGNAVTEFAAHATAPDVLVNNAGIGHVGSLLETTAEDLDRLLAVNVRGTFNLCKALVPAMIERGSGSVINLASIAGLIAVRERLAYTTSKFAIVGMTKALALDHSHSGVRFNAICPGRVETPFVMSRISEYANPEQAYREMAATQLTGRMAKPAEIASAALYLAADESTMVTGTTLDVDGGWGAGK